MRAAGIIERDGAVLLMHRINGNRAYYVFPGGTVANGETPQEACIREILEETSLVTRSIQPLGSQTENGRLVHYFHILDFAGTPALGGPEKEACSPSNHYSLEWVNRADLGQIAVFPANAQALISAQTPSPAGGGHIRKPAPLFEKPNLRS